MKTSQKKQAEPSTNPKIVLPKTNLRLLPTLSGHWYGEGGGARMKVYPSSTTILTAYPKAEELVKWIADRGYDNSQEYKEQRGEIGTNVHKAVEMLLDGTELDRRAYSLEEWYKISTYIKWHKEEQPETIGTEILVRSKKYGFAGKFDHLCFLILAGRSLGIVDWKTSKYLYKTYPLQIASYAAAFEEMTGYTIDFTAALHLGARNKNGYLLRVYDDWRLDFKRFLAVKEVFEHEHGVKPPEILELSDSFKL